MIVCPLHWYYSADHLAEVQAEMVRRGPPRLRGYLDEASGAFLLREGTHRIRAAQRLGLAPVLVPIPWWRARGRLDRARVAATTRGLRFPEVSISHMDESKQVCYKDPVTCSQLIEAIRAAMHAKNMTATALADAVGVAPQSLGRWLNGKHAPSVTNLEALARAVGLELHLRKIKAASGGDA